MNDTTKYIVTRIFLNVKRLILSSIKSFEFFGNAEGAETLNRLMLKGRFNVNGMIIKGTINAKSNETNK